MKRSMYIGVAVAFLAALLSMTMFYTVSFTEAAVETRLGRADAGRASRPGLAFKPPYPVASVTKYDTRVRFLEARGATQQTADDRQIVVYAYCTWRVADPLLFFQRFSNAGTRAEDHYTQAANLIRGALQSAVGETSAFRLDELFTPLAGTSRLADLEQRILGKVRGGAGLEAARGIGAYGVDVVDLGISKVELPAATSQAVFERMEQDRKQLVTQIQSRGSAEAQAIRSRADADARQIEQFARQRADQVRAQGDIEAQQFIAQMNEHPEFAVFLKMLDLLRESLSSRTTLVLSTSTPGLGPVSPQFLEGAAPGEIPGVSAVFDALNSPRRLLERTLGDDPPAGGSE
jgi:membrane protease subunit HflC